MKAYINLLNKYLISRKFPLLLVLFLAGLIFPTLSTSQYIIADDMRVPEINIDITLLKDVNYIWQYDAGLGEPGHINIVDIFPYHFIVYLFSKAGLNYILVQKLFIFLSFVGAGLGMYYLLDVLFNGKRPLGTFFGALFYVINPFAIAIPYFHFYNIFMLPYIFIPILLGNIINILDKGDRKYYFQAVAIFLLNISSLSNPGYLVVEFIPIGFYLIYKFLFDSQKQVTVRRVAIYGALFLLINSFWILPFINLIYSNSYSNVENSSIRVASSSIQKSTEYSTILNNFRLVNWPWYYTAPLKNNFSYRFRNFFENYSLYDTYLFLPAIIFIFAILLNNKRNENNKKFYFFSLFTVVILFLIKGPAPPFGDMFYDFNKIFPLYTALFMNIYTKYGLLLSLGYSVMMGYFVAALEFRIEGTRGKALLVIIILLLLTPLFIPYALKMTGPQYGYINVPNSYFESAEIINAYSGEGRVLDLPFPSINNFRIYKWGYIGAGIYFYFTSRPIIDQSYTVVSMFNQESLSNIRYSIEHEDKALLENFLDLYNIIFIVYHKDDIQYPDQVKGDINMMSNFTKIFSSPEIDIYSHNLSLSYYKTNSSILKDKNPTSDVLPHIYTTQAQITIPSLEQFIPTIKSGFLPGKQSITILAQNQNKTIPEVSPSTAPRIYFQKINPVKYKVKIESARVPFYLIFSESYHSAWKAYINTDAIQCSPISTYDNLNVTECQHKSRFFEIKDLNRIFDESIPEEKHFVVNGYANAWYIDPQTLGTGENFTITIYFKPQSYFYIGLIVSGLTLIGCTGYLFWDWRKRKTKKYKQKV
jgi:hypothetical protein